MAYDLLYKKQIPVNFSAHPTSEPSINMQTSLGLVTLGVAFLEAVLKKTGREAERHRYQQAARATTLQSKSLPFPWPRW